MTYRDYQFVIERSAIARDVEMIAMDIWHDQDLTAMEKFELGAQLGKKLSPESAVTKEQSHE